MIKIKNKIAALFLRRNTFANISEGTHAGSITMSAGEDVPCANLLVAAGENEGVFKIAGAGELPIGVCTDEGSSGEKLSVSLPGSAESTLLCRAASSISAGNSVYGTASGKVASSPENGACKIGVALCDASSGGIVEVDPQGFGSRAWQFHSAGVFSWNGGSSTTASLEVAGLKTGDLVMASIAESAGSETSVMASVDAGGDKINFTLNANGTNDSTKISWFAISKN